MIRIGNPNDAQAIAENNVALARETTGTSLNFATTLKGCQRILRDGRIGRYWLAYSDQRLSAQTLVLPEVSDWYDGDYWWISSVYVVPSARQQGILRALIDHVQLAAKEAGALQLKLQVDRHNASAKAAYHRLGFAPSEDDLLSLPL